MPLAAAIVPAVIGAGTALYGASQSKKAANKQLEAQTLSNDKSLAAQQANLDRIVGLNQNAISGGIGPGGAYDALLSRFGITPAAAPGAPAPAAPGAAPAGGGVNKTVGGPAGTSPAYPGAPQSTPGSAGGFDAATYLAQNPDVAEYAKQAAASGITKTPEQIAQEHYEQFGKAEGRAQPMTPATPATTITPDLMNGQRPTAPQLQSFERPEERQIGSFGSAPEMGSFFSNFEADPGAAFRKSEALGAVNANFAGRGALRSGGALKALMGRASDLGAQEYNNWFSRQNTQYNNARNAFTQDRSYQTNLWDTQQGRDDTNFQNDRAYDTGLWNYNTDRGDRNFNQDRGYQTERYDRDNANLFDLTKVGLSAAGNVSGAGTNFANNASNIFGNQGQAAGDAAYARANANAGAVGAIGGAATNLFQNWGGSGSGFGGFTPASNQAQPWNASMMTTRF